MSNTRRSRTGFYRLDGRKTVVQGFGEPLVPDIGRCSTCNKSSYISRANAKKVCKKFNLRSDHLVEPYRCRVNPDHWHVGGRRS